MQDAILRERHSVRKFGGPPLEKQTIKEILEEAAWAPSGGNLQPWKVVVLGPRMVHRFLACSEGQALYWIEPMMKLALLGLAKREGKDPPAKLNDFVISHMNPLVKMSDAPPSHMLAIYFEQKRLTQRIGAIAETASLVWYRLNRLHSFRERLHYLGSMVSRFFRMFAVDRAVQIMSLSNFIYAITLAACQRDIDSCIQCHFTVPKAHLRRLLRLGRRHDVLAFVALGHHREHNTEPTDKRFPRKRYAVPTEWME